MSVTALVLAVILLVGAMQFQDAFADNDKGPKQKHIDKHEEKHGDKHKDKHSDKKEKIKEKKDKIKQKIKEKIIPIIREIIKEWKDEICWCQSMPFCMQQRSINMTPTSRIIYEYHRRNGQTSKQINRFYAVRYSH